MRRFRWNKPCAADSCWLTSPGNAAEHVHLMMSLFEIFHDWPVRVEREDRGGGGLARTAAPDHVDFCSNTPHGNRTGCRRAASSIAR